VLAAARLVVGDSGTMSSEAAVLGTPAVFVSTARLGYLLDLEHRYGLMANLAPVDPAVAIAAASRLLAEAESGSIEQGRQQLLAETVDVTSWMVDFFEDAAERDWYGWRGGAGARGGP
jgi:predicted glycosyltransferase